jgi:1-acyl-sn-glycerol-3-phosphate acyltransferase
LSSPHLQPETIKKVFFWPYQLYAWLVLFPLSGFFTLLFSTLAVIFSILVSPRFASRVVASTWGRLLAWLIPIRVLVEGKGNAEMARSYVVVCNHQSAIDILVVYGWLKLDLKWVIKQELRKVPGLGIGCEKVGHIFVDRQNPVRARQAIEEALDRLGNGIGILFFIEGTRSTDGKLLPFKKGAFRTAIEQQLPVLPVTLVGTRDILPPDSFKVFPGSTRMIIHPAIETDGMNHEQTGELMKQAKQAISSALPEHLQ